MYRNGVKLILDTIVALIVFTLLTPLFLGITVFLSIVNEGKPFFYQKRPGKDEKIFRIVKFRTMNNKKDKSGNLLPDEARLTTVGKFIRATSLDEIPQLLNVLIGDMSIVGPRPLLPQYLPLYSEKQRKRHLVKPGITGWAQVNGRNAISWKAKLDFDAWYVENQSFWLDLQILAKTVYKVLKKEDINTEGQATTAPFNGEN